MAVVVKHAFISGKGDGPDATLVQPSDWNATHTIEGLGDLAELDLVDTGQVADNAITEGKVGAGAITAAKIGALAITEGKVAAEAISFGKIAPAVAATQEEAEAGTVANKFMTPQRTAQYGAAKLVASATIRTVVKLSQTAYDALDPPVATTLYLIEEE